MRPACVLVGVVAVVLASSLPRGAAAQGSALLLPVRGPGADDASLTAADNALQRRLQEHGYTVRPHTGAVLGTGLSVDQLAALARAEGTVVAVDPELQDFAGMPSLRIRIVTSQGALAGEASDLASAGTLPQDAARVLARAMPAGLPAAPTPPPPPPDGGVEAPWDAAPPDSAPTVSEGTGDDDRPRRRRRRRRRRRPRAPEFAERSVWIGAMIEPAMGTNRSAFSLMVGPRFEYRWRGLIAGLNLDYTYVIDWEPRSEPNYHTLALFPVLGYAISLGSERFSLPLVASGGYIPGNGGLLRFEAGLAYKPNDRLDLRFIFVCPNFWFLEDQTVLFVSFSLQALVGI